MNLICPLCNGLVDRKMKCLRCVEKMKDNGPLVDYLDSYSPYLSRDITQLVDGVAHDECIHIFQCDRCGYDKKMVVQMINK
ncbi:hypothetical protein Curi_c09750 [Gottschalkia acidurici 9a]|uniref:Uncharacterized protein n=1 Tax=Gottschalkia acidurici (strain ATCC 7906 / DSM 604 / BCRC 14475 / CIP 104303 / KCTC 5404 / NCIMB 10678 / 9a) TaxID=1128398 RepID=K0B030_GOTA9|nr:hypothetical protein [Gottschalkia acidurici]AFS77991.1 hypothetical protein Curi_c09750 [Gottschalkia acidurici 9a]